MGEARVEYVVTEAPRDPEGSLISRHKRIFESANEEEALKFFDECLASDEKWYYLEECYIKTERKFLKSK